MDYVQAFLDNIMTEGLSDNTYRGYGHDLRAFFKAVKVEPLEVTSFMVRQYQSDGHKRGLKPSTLGRRLASLKSFYKFLEDEDIITTSPVRKLKTPKLPKHTPEYLEWDEYRLLVDNTNDLRLKAILTVLYATGARVSEFANLNKDDFDFDAMTVNIRKGKGAKQRYAYLDDEAVVCVKAYWATRTDSNPAAFVGRGHKDYKRTGQWVEPQRIMVPVIQAQVREQGVRCGIKKRVHPHKLRKTMACHLALAGADILMIKDCLGHENIATTQIYATLNDKVRRRQYDHFRKEYRDQQLQLFIEPDDAA